MHLLTESFRKENIEHIGCQIVMACEAGEEEKWGKKKNGKRGSVKRDVAKILR